MLLSTPLAQVGLNATNTTTAEKQWAEQFNASGGQVTPLLFGNSLDNNGGLSITGSTPQAQGVVYSDNQKMKTTNFAKDAANQVRTLKPQRQFDLPMLNYIGSANLDTKTNLARAIAARDAQDQYNVDDNANIFKRVKQITDGEGRNQIADAFSKGNNLQAYGIAAKTALYDMIAPESYLGAGFLVLGGPSLRTGGKAFSATFPAASSWLANMASKEIGFGASSTPVTGSQWNGLFSTKYGENNVFWDWPKNQGFVYGADEIGSLKPGQLIG